MSKQTFCDFTDIMRMLQQIEKKIKYTVTSFSVMGYVLRQENKQEAIQFSSLPR